MKHIKRPLIEAVDSKARKFVWSMIFVGFIFLMAYMIQPVFAADVEYYDSNYQISDYQGLFNYTAPSFDHQPLTLTITGTVNKTPVELSGQVIGNISVVSRPVGWDLVLPTLIYCAILLTAITILQLILCGFFILRLNK